ncbi:MAG: nitrate ABC transporter ATP-binding protein [Desulfitibacter sp. BRH_c19]|nr:MAG: nitrate ABC transporter ATP-binding protein [Desulfitibacter sp. BRH_c19]
MALLLNSICKNFNELVVLKDISLQVNEREFICIVGPSGCGKSTLLRIIAGFEHPTSGSVKIDNEKVYLSDGDIGFVFQENSLFPWLTVKENIAFGLRVNTTKSRKNEKIIHYFLDLIGLKHFADYYPHQLSGGMKQRVQIARAMAYNPKLLLMDEPFASLDAQTRNMMQDELLNIWFREQKTVLFITHSIDEAIYLADRILIFDINPGTIKEILEVKIQRPRVRTAKDFNEIREYALKLIENEETSSGAQKNGKIIKLSVNR